MMRVLLSRLLLYCFGFCVDSERRHSLVSLSLASSNNPNPIDNETPQERQARMDQVRRIQAVFYRSDDRQFQNKDQDASSSSSSFSCCWSFLDPSDPSLVHNLPLWRVQWTELPGFQSVLNVHVPHYTHMFRQIIYQNQNNDWYFGHVYLPQGSENINSPKYALPKEDTDEPLSTVTTIGTLMKITDYKEQDDGRITLLVQAVGRIQILAAQQQVPYAVADTARLLVDWEASKVHDKLDNEQLSQRYSLKQAQAITAVKQSQLLRELEFLPVKFADSNDQDEDIPSVSPLSNVNGQATVDWEDIQEQLNKCFQEQIQTDTSPHSCQYQRQSAVDHEIKDLEQKVWISLDRLLQLLEAAQPGFRIPLPTQLLGLLPTEQETGSVWPGTFRLQRYANQLQDKAAVVGTSTKSPFVRLSEVFPEYPVLRRASRLSYTIWLLIGSIAIGNEAFDRQAYLETHSLRMRLLKTLSHMNGINATLEQIVKG